MSETDDCIFCSIVAGEIPSRTVYEDDDVLAFLDANPLAPGHTLVVPKEHHERLHDVPDRPASLVYRIVHKLSGAAENAVDADGATIGINDGEAAGQEVPHVHAHIIPRFDDDGAGPIHAAFGERPDLSEDELDEIADSISSYTLA